MKLHALIVSLTAFASLAGGRNLAQANPPSNQSVAGKPFRVSESVTSYCAPAPVPLTMCEAFKPLLAEFLAESRDDRWAVTVEPLVARYMLVNGQPRAKIRALECRRTMCAVEYAVFSDDLDHDADGDPELDRILDPVGGVMAPELPEVGGRAKIVSVLIWRKRS